MSFNKCTAKKKLHIDASVTLGLRHRLKRWPSILWCLCTYCTSEPLRPALLRTKGRQNWLTHMPIFSDIDPYSITWLSYHLEKSRWGYRSCQTLSACLASFRRLADNTQCLRLINTDPGASPHLFLEFPHLWTVCIYIGYVLRLSCSVSGLQTCCEVEQHLLDTWAEWSTRALKFSRKKK